MGGWWWVRRRNLGSGRRGLCGRGGFVGTGRGLGVGVGVGMAWFMVIAMVRELGVAWRLWLACLLLYSKWKLSRSERVEMIVFETTIGNVRTDIQRIAAILEKSCTMPLQTGFGRCSSLCSLQRVFIRFCSLL